MGLLISPVFARLLPFGWDGHVAAFTMNADRSSAETTLMQAGNPEAWNIFRSDFELVKDNQVAFPACRDTAAKTKKEQRCDVAVPAQ